MSGATIYVALGDLDSHCAWWREALSLRRWCGWVGERKLDRTREEAAVVVQREKSRTASAADSKTIFYFFTRASLRNRLQLSTWCAFYIQMHGWYRPI